MPNRSPRAALFLHGLLLPMLLLLPADAPAEETIRCDLRRCIEEALNRSPAVRLSRIETETAEASLRRARTEFYPKLDLNLGLAEFSGEPTSFFSVFDVTEAEIVNRRVLWGEYAALTLDFHYPLYREGSLLGRNAPSIASVEIQKQQTAFSARETREEVIYRVTEAYLDALRRTAQIRIEEERTRILEQRLSILQSQADLKLTPPHEAELARADLSVRRTSLSTVRELLIEAKTRLARQTGFSDPDRIELDEAFPPLPELPSRIGLAEQWASEHPKLGFQQNAADRSRAALEISRSQRFPTVALQSSYTYADDFRAPGNNFFLAMLKLEMPLFDFGSYRAGVSENELRLRAEEIRLEAVRDDLRTAIGRTYAAIRETAGQVAVLEKEVLKTELELKSIRAQRDQGLTGPLSVLEAELRLQDRRQSLEEARHASRLSHAELQRATGGAWTWLP